VVTATVTAPALFAGVFAVIEVALTTVTFVAFVPPKVTAVALVRFVPVIVTLVPPAVGPELGLTLVTVGVAARTIIAEFASSETRTRSSTNQPAPHSVRRVSYRMLPCRSFGHPNAPFLPSFG